MDDEKKIVTHPSHGLIHFSRISGGIGTLFGSSVRNHSCIRMTVSLARSQFDHGQQWHFSDQELIEVDMSPVQFAEAMTTLNVGSGVPCTIRSINNKRVPNPEEDNVPEKHRANFKDRCQEFLDSIGKSIAEIEAALSKPSPPNKSDKEKIKVLLHWLQTEIGSNMPFFVKQFSEAVEKMIVDAKGEVDAFVTNLVVQTGLEKLREMQPSLTE